MTRTEPQKDPAHHRSGNGADAPTTGAPNTSTSLQPSPTARGRRSRPVDNSSGKSAESAPMGQARQAGAVDEERTSSRRPPIGPTVFRDLDQGRCIVGKPGEGRRPEGDTGMHVTNDQELRGSVISRALRRCPSLRAPSRQRDELWVAVRSAICTHGVRSVVPLGSKTPVMVSDEYVSDELIATMNWLTRHERHARRLTPLKLFITLRGVATKNGGGSARHAQSDELRGFSNVVAGDRIRFVDCDISELEL